ncbi:MAG TPA: hypothetical protein VGO14_02945 [Solirubrobacteraceae bacterium]|jgi:hypothetical protein|nr:hypothetical protein [Solirubrobacteraceae bacterium]
MTLPTRLTGAIAIAATAGSLAIPSVAGAKAGDRTFQQTYPLASRVCTEVAAGQRKHLQRFAPQIAADCALLQAGFTSAQTTILAARTAITGAIAADRAVVTAACPPPMVGKTACENTRHTESVAIGVLRHQLIAAARRYYVAIETNRHAFWHAIHALRGAAHLRSDAPIRVENS